MGKKYKALLFTMLAIIPTTAYAAKQGVAGAVSIGNFIVNIEIPAKIRISNLANFDLGVYTSSGDLETSRDICVYTNTPSSRYRVTATGSGAANAFTVNNAGTAVAYNAKWNDKTGPGGGVTLTSGIPLTSQTGANSVSESCASGGLSANIYINMAEADLTNKPNGTYSGTLTLLIEPD